MTDKRPDDDGAPRVTELRCGCRRLLARIDRGAVLLKCPRCKREARLSLAQQTGEEIEVCFT